MCETTLIVELHWMIGKGYSKLAPAIDDPVALNKLVPCVIYVQHHLHHQITSDGWHTLFQSVPLAILWHRTNSVAIPRSEIVTEIIRRTLWQVKFLTISHLSTSFSQFTTVPSLFACAMTSRPSPTNSSRGANLDVFSLERENEKLRMNGLSDTSQKKDKLAIKAVKGMGKQPHFIPQSMLSNVLERDIDDMSWMNHTVLGTKKIPCASEETKNYADNDSMKTNKTANSSQGTHVDVCALKRELSRIVLGA
jgi:hypothetical protein